MSLTFTTHIGTHLDTPMHMIQGAKGLADYSVADFCGKGKCVPLDKVATTDLTGIDYLLLYTGWDQYWNNDQYFNDFPVLDREAAQKQLFPHDERR